MRPSLLYNLLIFFLFVQTSFSISPIVKDVCGKISSGYNDYNFCVQALEAEPKSKSADILGLAAISVNLSIANATSIEFKIMELMKNVSEPSTKKSLETCSYLYKNTAITDLKRSADFIASKNFTAAKDEIDSASLVGITCEEALRQFPLTKDCNDFSNLTLLTTSIIKSLA